VNVSKSSFSHTLAERGFTRFVLLRPRGAACPPSLAESFRGRWHQVTQVFDPLNALAELCVLDRAEQPRREWGLTAQEKVALIVVEQEAWNSITDLLKIVRTRLSAISIWNYTDNLVVEVSVPPKAAQQRPHVEPQKPATHGKTPGGGGYGTLRLTGSYPAEGTGTESSPSQSMPPDATEKESPPNTDSDDPQDAAPHNVSPEELEMLLGLLEDGEDNANPPKHPEDGEPGLEQRKDPRG
jgi:hypothetical protein